MRLREYWEDQSVTTPFPGFRIGDAVRFAVAHGLQAEAHEIESMAIDPRIKKRHVPRKGRFVELFESRGLLDAFTAQYWPGRHTDLGQRRWQSYLDQLALNDRLLRGEPADEDTLDTIPGSADDSESDASITDPVSFAMEAQLRDFIAANISQIAIGGTKLRLYTDDGGRGGKEYPTGVGPIDILAVDGQGTFFVFELKLERGPDRALGQLARYMGWIKVNLASGREVRGVVVARTIDERLRYAASVIPNVALLEYTVTFNVRDVGSMTAQPTPPHGPDERGRC